jgi:hypothetical protein
MSYAIFRQTAKNPSINNMSPHNYQTYFEINSPQKNQSRPFSRRESHMTNSYLAVNESQGYSDAHYRHQDMYAQQQGYHPITEHVNEVS